MDEVSLFTLLEKVKIKILREDSQVSHRQPSLLHRSKRLPNNQNFKHTLKLRNFGTSLLCEQRSSIQNRRSQVTPSK